MECGTRDALGPARTFEASRLGSSRSQGQFWPAGDVVHVCVARAATAVDAADAALGGAVGAGEALVCAEEAPWPAPAGEPRVWTERAWDPVKSACVRFLGDGEAEAESRFPDEASCASSCSTPHLRTARACVGLATIWDEDWHCRAHRAACAALNDAAGEALEHPLRWRFQARRCVRSIPSCSGLAAEHDPDGCPACASPPAGTTAAAGVWTPMKFSVRNPVGDVSFSGGTRRMRSAARNGPRVDVFVRPPPRWIVRLWDGSECRGPDGALIERAAGAAITTANAATTCRPSCTDARITRRELCCAFPPCRTWSVRLWDADEGKCRDEAGAEASLTGGPTTTKGVPLTEPFFSFYAPENAGGGSPTVEQACRSSCSDDFSGRIGSMQVPCEEREREWRRHAEARALDIALGKFGGPEPRTRDRQRASRGGVQAGRVGS
jgi:hypothetical protein